MEGAMTSLRNIHVLSVSQFEEEMSSFRLGLRRLRATGFKWTPAPLRLRCLASSQAAAKKRWNPLAGNFPVSVTVSCLSVFVM